MDLLFVAYCLNVLMFVGLIVGYVVLSKTMIKRVERVNNSSFSEDATLVIQTTLFSIFVPLIVVKLLLLISVGSCMKMTCGKGWYILWGVLFCLISFVRCLQAILGMNVIEDAVNSIKKNDSTPSEEKEVINKTLDDIILIVKILVYIELAMSGLMFASIIYSDKYVKKKTQKVIYVQNKKTQITHIINEEPNLSILFNLQSALVRSSPPSTYETYKLIIIK